MLVVTTDNLPGYDIREVLGEVIGVTARTNNPFNEGIRSLHGGSNPKMVASLIRWREEAVERMAQEALKRGANAIVGMRFDHRDLAPSWIEICAYGTAAVVTAAVRRDRSRPGGASPRRRPDHKEPASVSGHDVASGRAATTPAAAPPSGAPAEAAPPAATLAEAAPPLGNLAEAAPPAGAPAGELPGEDRGSGGGEPRHAAG